MQPRAEIHLVSLWLSHRFGFQKIVSISKAVQMMFLLSDGALLMT
jgi:hypothetical protein